MSSLEERQRQNVELVRAGVGAFQRDGVEGILSLAREDFEIFLPPDLPNSGTFVGRDGFLTWIGQWLDAWEDFTVEIAEAEPVGERHVVAMVHQAGRGKGSGVPVEMVVAYLWEVRDGRFAAMHLYASQEDAVRVAEQRERGSAD